MRHVRDSRGFTVVEIAVVVPIIMIVVLGVFAIITSFLQSTAADRTGAQNLYDIQVALNAIEQDVSLSTYFLPTPDAGLSDPNQPSSGWSYAGTDADHRVLILRTYATKGNPQSNDRQPVFLNTNGCDDSTLYYNPALSYDTIYFVNGDTLYRRKLITVPNTVCSTPYQKQSCPNGAGCAAADEVVATNVSSFAVAYYGDSSTDTPYDAYGSSGNQIVLDSSSALVTISVQRKVRGQPLTNTLSLRMSKLITGGGN